MNLLLLLYLIILMYTALGSLPAPVNLSVSSFNFHHVVHWTPGHGSPPDALYLIYKRCPKNLKLIKNSTKTWAEVILDIMDTQKLCVQTSFNNSLSPLSNSITFTPYLQTTITVPNMTVSGCEKCVQVNISLPRDVSKYRTIMDNVNFNVSWKEQGEEAAKFIQTKNSTVVIEHLHHGSEYCVQVSPRYLKIIFQPSPWICVFTSQALQRPVFAVVGVVAALLVLSISALALVLVCLQYTGLICKLKEALPQTLIAALVPGSPLSLERTVPERVFIIPRTERGLPFSNTQDSSSDEEDDREQSGAHYIDGDHLSSGSSSSCVPGTQSSQSAPKHAGILMERINERQEEAHGDKGGKCKKVENVMKNESRDSQKQEIWEDVLEASENVNLCSVTTAALVSHREDDPKELDLEPLFKTAIKSDSHLPDQQQFSDTEQEEETELSNYMRH